MDREVHYWSSLFFGFWLQIHFLIRTPWPIAGQQPDEQPGSVLKATRGAAQESGGPVLPGLWTKTRSQGFRSLLPRD